MVDSLIDPTNDGELAPASFAQERLWFLARLEPEKSLYNLPFAMRFRGALDHDALREAIAAVVVKHEALRTRFVEVDGDAKQIVDPPWRPDVPLIDVSGSADPAAAATREATEEGSKLFELAQGRLLRALLIRLDDTDHIIVVTMHHAIADGWSLPIIVRDLRDAYEAVQSGRRPELGAAAVQFTDYAIWQRAWLQGEVLERQRAWWRNEMSGRPAATQLPTDHIRPAVASHRGATVAFAVPRDVTEGLRALAREERSSLFMVLLAAWASVLARHSSMRDLSIGTPVANRTRIEFEDVVGFFVNTLVMRVDVGRGLTFRELLRRVRDTCFGAYANQDLPFEQLVEDLAPDRDLSRHPLVQVMFQLQHQDDAIGRFGAAEASVFPVPNVWARFDLSLTLQDDGRDLRGTIEFATDLFTRATGERLADHFGNVLASAVASPDNSEAAMISEAEQHRVLQWSEGGPVGVDEAVHHVIAREAAAHPERVAVVGGRRRLTYGELDSAANRLAHHLVRRGANTESIVGVCLDRGPDAVVGLLAVWKAGGAYLPLDPLQPSSRHAALLGDASVSLVVTTSELARALPAGVRFVVLDDPDEAELIGLMPSTPPTRNVTPANLAYVIYTSGSTGRPKGVMVEHGSVVRLARGDCVNWRDAHQLVQGAPMAFDASIFEIWGALCNGATVAVLDDEVLTPEALAQAARNGADTVWLTAGLFHAIVDVDPSCLALFRTVVAGGQSLSVTHVERAMSAAPGTTFRNGYGPTECTTFACCHTIDHTTGPSIPIGRPIAGTRALVLDDSLALCPVRVPGELWLGGSGLARGYLASASLTAERFVPDPFGLPGARLYRTGDRVRWLDTGALEFLGRFDDQVKIRGFRVEPAEVEALLVSSDRVAEAAVVPTGSPIDQSLVAYVVPGAGFRLDSAELRAWLRDRVPEHLVPATFVELDSLPLNSNGKLDKEALPDPAQSKMTPVFEAPSSPTEAAIAEAWSFVLGCGPVGLQDNFFDLGGHSLLVTRVVARLRETLGVELSLRKFFEYPTVAELARNVDAADSDAMRRKSADRIPVASRAGLLPASFAQTRLWFLSRLEPDNPFYNVPLALRLTGWLDLAALRGALSDVVSRHEVLRSRIVAHEGVPLQLIDPPSPVDVPLIDVTAEADPLAAAMAVLDREARSSFDLESGPMLRACVVRVAQEVHYLSITLHHVASDGWSLGVMTSEIGAFYVARTEQRAIEMTPLHLHYADFALWQRDILRGEELDSLLRWWHSQLEGAPAALGLPTDHARPPTQSFRGRNVSFVIPAEVVDLLVAIALAERTTLFVAILAAWACFLARHAGEEEVCIGTPVAGRGRAELEALIGCFVNTVVLRLPTPGVLTYRVLINRAREVVLDALEHQDLPFERLVEEVSPERDLSRHPLFQATLAYHAENERVDLVLPGVAVELVGPDAETARVDLSLDIWPRKDGIQAKLTYATDLFEEDTVTRMASNFVTFLSRAAEEPDRPAHAVDLLAEAERSTLEAWSSASTGDLLDVRSTAPEVIHQVAEQRPSSVAVVAAEASISYGELDLRATELAHRLRGYGVSENLVVAVFLDRGIDAVVALLAIWKAGAAFLALDPEHPEARLGQILDAASPAVIVTSGVLERRLPVHWAVVVLIDAEETGASPTDALPSPPSGSLAYLMFTSGSTGGPKGVMVEHRGLANLIAAQQSIFRDHMHDGCRVLQFASWTFDASIWEIVLALASGGTLVIAPRAPELLVRAMNESGVEIATLPPAILDAIPLHDVPSLATVVLAGERLHFDALQVLGSRVIYNAYGPTEMTVCSTIHSVQIDVDQLLAAGGSVPIGCSIPGVESFVVDRFGELVPIGVAGELVHGGVGVARGYLDSPRSTAEKFVPHPFAYGRRVYRTGDRARWLSAGTLQFLGRVDNQTKIRGHRVEPGEVEAAVASCSGVAKAAVVVREDRWGAPQLVAYVVPSIAGQQLADLRSHLRSLLPEYLIPATFVTVDEIPLNQNKKTDYAALPPVDTLSSGGGTGTALPASDHERVLAEIWSDVLAVDIISVTDDFFNLGGHSLLATQIVSRVEDRLGVTIPLRKIFEFPTVRELALLVPEAPATARAVPVRLVPRDGPMPVSLAQQRLWFLDQLEPGSAFYNVPLAARLRGELDPDVLERAVLFVVERHEILRTRIVAVDGVPMQIVGPPAVTLESFDTSNDEDPSHEAHRIFEALSAEPFDLSTGPLLRLCLLTLAPRDHVVVILMHHVVADGWSIGILTREMRAAYTALSRGTAPDLEAPPIQYADYASWQRDWLTHDVVASELAWWCQRLAGAPFVLDLPADRLRPPVQSYRGATVEFEIAAPLTEALRALGVKEGTTLFAVALAAWGTVLGGYAGVDDVCIGVPVANRTRETELLIGFFVNTLVMRIDLSGAPSALDVVRRTRDFVISALEHEHLPFERLVSELAPERDLGRSPLVQASFQMQSGVREPLSFGQTDHEPFATTHATALYDVGLSIKDDGGPLFAVVDYCVDLFERSSIEQLSAHLVAVLEAIVENPESSCFAALTKEADAARERSLGLDSQAELHSSVLDLVVAQATRTPDAIAVIAGDHEVSYRDLNRRSNQLANHLLALGAEREQAVAVCLDRSVEDVVAMLAVWKAGAAYVPLDPSYPETRLRTLFQDCGASIAIVRRGYDFFRDIARDVVGLDDDDAAIGARDAEAIGGLGPDKNNLAYVLYTSGSTGEPKGVLVEHQSLRSRVRHEVRRLGLTAEDSVASISPTSVDVHFTDVLPILTCGGRLIIWQERLSPNEFASRVANDGVTVVDLPTAYCRLFAQDHVELPAPIRAVTFGGEVAHVPDFLRWLEQMCQRGVRIFNAYGPTETTVTATVHEVLDTATLDGRSIPIGQPVSATAVLVLNDAGDEVPTGVPGELYLGGIGVARGYLRDPAQTAARFVPSPAGRLGGRVYATGDLVRWKHDGNLEFLGRRDDQVKIRGYRVEPGELEAALSANIACASSAVITWQDAPGGPALAAYIVPAEGVERPSEESIRRWLVSRVPHQLLPAAVMVLDSLPLTPNGKIDRGALPSPSAGRSFGSGRRPRTDAERTLLQIWRQVLMVEGIGTDDGFFELGGDSILSMQMVNLANRAGLAIRVRDVFEYQSIAELARVASQSDLVSEVDSPDGPVALTPIQRWFFAQDLVDRSHWNQSMLLRIDESINDAALKAALDSLVHRHDALRMRFREDRGGWSCRDETGASSTFSSLRLESASEFEAVANAAQASLDISVGPVFSAVRIAMPDHQHRLLLVAHHLVIDAVSWLILLGELDAALAETPEPIIPASRFASFAGALERARAAAAVASLPVGGHVLQPKAGARNFERDSLTLVAELGEDDCDAALKRYPRLFGVRPDAVLIVALAAGVRSVLSPGPVIIDVEAHGRDAVSMDASSIVGWFTMLFPISVPDGPIDSTVAAVHRAIAESTRDSAKAMPDEFDTEKIGAAGVTFNFLGSYDPTPKSSSWILGQATESRGNERGPANARTSTLDVAAIVRGERLRIEFTYARDAIDDMDIRAICDVMLVQIRSLARTTLGIGTRVADHRRHQ